MHTVVARSTFPSQNVQSTPASDHFWKLACQKVNAVMARSTFQSQKLAFLNSRKKVVILESVLPVTNANERGVDGRVTYEWTDVCV